MPVVFLLRTAYWKKQEGDREIALRGKEKAGLKSYIHKE